MFSIGEIASRVGGALVGGAEAAALVPSGFIVDSRRASPGTLFFALPGATADGHEFLGDAFARGAAAAVVSDSSVSSCAGRRTLIRVPDVQTALQALGAAWRARFSVPVVGITGSNGKTTTKALLAHLAGACLHVHAAPENFNTEVGVPLALLTMPSDAEVGVFEMGADRPGDIALLSGLLRPTLGILTSIGPTHLELFGTTEAVAGEKWNLVRGLPSGAKAFVNADSPEIRALAAPEQDRRLVTVGMGYGNVRVRVLAASPRLVVELSVPALRLETGLVGAQNATNLALAALCAIELGVPARDVERQAASFRPVGHRMEPRPTRFGVVLDDVYNANLASMTAALQTLIAYGGEERPRAHRVAVLGDMLGLGRASRGLHDDLARIALGLPLDAVYPIGEQTAAAFAAAGDSRVRRLERGLIAADVVSRLAGERDAVVLVKGSRGMKLEEIADELVRLALPDGSV